MKSKIFIGSSVESLPWAYAVQESLEHEAVSTVWTQGIFNPSATALESIFSKLDAVDYGIFILAADDLANLRGNEVSITRGNVVFELGIFVGRIGIKRTFLLIPSDVDNFRLPTDLLGIVPLTYESKRVDYLAALGSICNKIRRNLSGFTSSIRPAGLKSEVTVLTNVNEGSKYAADRVKASNLIRVIGTARQDVLDEVSEASDYLRATEERASSEKAFSYLRITSPVLSTSFRHHLLKLFQVFKTKQGGRIEIALESRMDTSVSYMIFDDEELLLIVDNTVFGSVRDNRVMIWSRDRDVVKAFSNHFDHAWNRIADKCITKSQFERASSAKK